jgi:hypothetical protein
MKLHILIHIDKIKINFQKFNSFFFQFFFIFDDDSTIAYYDIVIWIMKIFISKLAWYIIIIFPWSTIVYYDIWVENFTHMKLANNNYEGFSTPQLNIFQKRKQFQNLKDYLMTKLTLG